MLNDEHQRVALLLSCRLGDTEPKGPTPLTAIEYGTLESWLSARGATPGDLITRWDDVTRGWSDPSAAITRRRLTHLLARRAALAEALERWTAASIWTITRGDPEYPTRLRTRLGVAAPPVLFGVGARQLVSAGGLAVVGSREVDDSDGDYVRRVARCAVEAGLNIVSGGARGVDEIAMTTALDAGGTVLGLLASDLLAAPRSTKWKRHLTGTRLCLISTNPPETRFHVGFALGRNKFIYCLADRSLVAKSANGEGGTWSGATEALKQGYGPLFVADRPQIAGNVALARLGAIPLQEPPNGIHDASWLRSAFEVARGAAASGRPSSPIAPGPVAPARRDVVHARPAESRGVADGPAATYARFVQVLERLLSERPKVSLDDVHASIVAEARPLAIDWVARALREGHIARSQLDQGSGGAARASAPDRDGP
jgi:predicted Rossmann fold nucleotide-binding protein DprA/Smf involved in DNA uptake